MLLSILLFNLAGYTLLFDHFIQRSYEQQIHARIDYANKGQDVPANAKNTIKKNAAGFEYQQPVARFTVRTITTTSWQPFHQPAISAAQAFISGPYHPPGYKRNHRLLHQNKPDREDPALPHY
jgi:hypothetical protein